jgi:hypothetical protein
MAGNVALLKRSEGPELVGYGRSDIPDDDGSEQGAQDAQNAQDQSGEAPEDAELVKALIDEMRQARLVLDSGSGQYSHE